MCSKLFGMYYYLFLWLVAAKVAENKIHMILGKDFTVELKKPTTVSIAEPSPVSSHEQAAILVNNVADSISDALLYLYFDNITELEGESGDYTMTRCDGSQLMITFISSAILPTGGMYICSCGMYVCIWINSNYVFCHFIT